MNLDPSLCKRCGRCCHRKYVIDGIVHISDDPGCSNFNAKTRLCIVYDFRKGLPYCHTVEEGLKQGLMPADCAFVLANAAELKDYKAPVEDGKEKGPCS